MLALDSLINEVAGKGKYQIPIILLVSTVMIFNAFMNLSFVFQAALPASTRCHISPYDNTTLYPNITEETIQEVFIPYLSGKKKYSSCTRKVYQLTPSNFNKTINISQFTNKSSTTTNCPDGYVYEKDWFTETIVTEWDLVCDQSILAAVSASVFYFGMFLGSIVGGVLSDRFGRLFIFRWSVFVSTTLGCSASFAPSLVWYTTLKFLLAVSLFQAVGSGFTYITEISKTNWRVRIGLFYNTIFCIGFISFSGFAYYLNNWRTLQLATSLVVSIPLFVLTWFLPKSPRWLLSQYKSEEAKILLKKMSRLNGSQFSEDKWKIVLKETEKSIQEKEKRQDEVSDEKSFLNFFRKPYLRYVTCSNMFVWMITSLLYYGLALSGGTLPGNIFVNISLLGVVELIAVVLAIPCVSYFGCTKTVSATLFQAGIFCLLSTLVSYLSNENKDLETVATVTSMIGRFGVGATFATLFLQTVEMYPTVGRTTAFGLASMAARIGSIFSPFTAHAQYKIPWLSPLIYGSTACIAGLIASTFPETRKTELTTTFDETEEMFKNHLHNRWPAKIFCLPKPNLKVEAEEVPLHQDSKALKSSSILRLKLEN